jgi:pectin methylesterase-like acyl-CoA thioesterase
MKKTTLLLRLGTLGALLSATHAFADLQTWTGLGADQNWSTGGNWTNETALTSGAAPGATDDVRFFDNAFVTPTVDGLFGGTIASLRFGSTNNDYTLTLAGTLNITGAGGLRVGTPGDGVTTTVVRTATLTGAGGTLNLNNASANLVLNQGANTANGSRAILNLEGLDNFTANLRGIALGSVGYANTVAQRNSGTLYLAKTNLITLSLAHPLATYVTAGATTNALEMVQVGAGNNAGVLSTIFLGQTNAIFVDSLGIGRSKASTTSAATIRFNPNFTSPSAYFRGIAGDASRVTWWSLGDMSGFASSAQHAVGTNNFSGGTVNALVETLSLGRDCTANHTASGVTRINTGVLTFDNGLIDANTVIIGNQSLGPNTSLTMNMGIVNVAGAGATLVVNSNIALAQTTHSGPSALGTSGFLNVSAGTVRANSITVGAASTNNAINLSSGATLIITNTVGAAKPVRTITLNDSALTLHLTGGGPVVSATNVTTGGAGNTINVATATIFSSYPAQIQLIKYGTLGGSGNNFTLGSVPASIVGAYLSNNTFNSSIDLYIPTDPRPVISSQPSGFAGGPGSLVTMTVTADGVNPLSYQWRRDSTNISDVGNWSGSATDTLNITSAQESDSGDYTVAISNAYGSTTSSVATVTISLNPIAPNLNGPNNQSVLQGNIAVFSASASGFPAPDLQWFKNGVELSGENANTLTLLNVQYPADQATYSLRATNSAGVASNYATLTVIVPPGIVTEPSSQTVAQGSPAAFTIVASGNPAPTYQWTKNGNAIANATNATLSFGAALPTDAANYAVLASNAGGSTNSVTVTLTVTSTSLTYTNLSPADDATAVCYDTPLYIKFNNTPALGTAQLRIYDTNNTLVDTIDLSQNGPNGTQIRTIAGTAYYTYPVITRSNTATIFPHLGVLSSNMEYYVIMDTGFFKDTGGASLTGISSPTAWTFTTKEVGPDSSSVNDIMVAADGSGDFATVQGAIDWVPAGNTTPRTITLKKGAYEEVNRIPSGKNNLTFIGEGCQESILTYRNNDTVNPGTGTRIMFFAGGNDCTFKNIWFANSTPQGGSQAESIRVQGSRNHFDNCKFTSYQDTILINNALVSAGFFNKCLVQGDVDFIWGSGIGFFQSSEIKAMRRAGNGTGVYTQARTDASTYGLIFADCLISRETNDMTGWSLGRDANTSGPFGSVAWLNCRMDAHIGNFGWTDGGLADKSTLRFWEYQSTDLNGTLLNTASRVAWSVQVDASTNALLRNLTNTFASVSWVPMLATYVACEPTNQTAYLGQTVTLRTAVGGTPEPVYQWYKGAAPVSGATNSNLVLPNTQAGDAATYSLRATNELGYAISSNAMVTLVSPPSLVTPTVLGNGSAQFTFSGISGTGYRIWGHTNVAASPITSTWSLLSSGTFGGSPVTYTDTQAPNFPQRFYILTLP